MDTAQYWIEHLDLKQHPEGGHYRELYRSTETVAAESLPYRYGGDRSLGTSIYYLLRGNEVSHLHRLMSDELWHFYQGACLILHCFDDRGNYSRHQLGGNQETGCQFQIVINKGTWFGAEVTDSRSYALVGCTVSPGFDFNDFELADREKLLQQYPHHKKIIEKLSR